MAQNINDGPKKSFEELIKFGYKVKANTTEMGNKMLIFYKKIKDKVDIIITPQSAKLVKTVSKIQERINEKLGKDKGSIRNTDEGMPR